MIGLVMMWMNERTRRRRRRRFREKQQLRQQLFLGLDEWMDQVFLIVLFPGPWKTTTILGHLATIFCRLLFRNLSSLLSFLFINSFLFSLSFRLFYLYFIWFPALVLSLICLNTPSYITGYFQSMANEWAPHSLRLKRHRLVFFLYFSCRRRSFAYFFFLSSLPTRAHHSLY